MVELIKPEPKVPCDVFLQRFVRGSRWEIDFALWGGHEGPHVTAAGAEFQGPK